MWDTSRTWMICVIFILALSLYFAIADPYNIVTQWSIDWYCHYWDWCAYLSLLIIERNVLKHEIFVLILRWNTNPCIRNQTKYLLQQWWWRILHNLQNYFTSVYIMYTFLFSICSFRNARIVRNHIHHCLIIYCINFSKKWTFICPTPWYGLPLPSIWKSFDGCKQGHCHLWPVLIEIQASRPSTRIYPPTFLCTQTTSAALFRHRSLSWYWARVTVVLINDFARKCNSDRK
jgi:hypothetical protein